ncbi:MAG: YvrJ family protein [Thermoanaerobacteraceae bacterium]|nr:YvrJ family protein [Thermoanaerobacteraceae bacterium]
MEPVWNQIGNFGFPIVVSIYLLVRVEKKLDDLTEAIYSLKEVIKP